MYQFKKKILLVLLLSMVEAENFSEHPSTKICTRSHVNIQVKGTVLLNEIYARNLGSTFLYVGMCT
jgi:hypothetical protein